MRKKFIIFVLLSVSYECNGGLLQGFLEGAHELRKQIHGAAGAVLGGISNGLNINGHFGINTQHDNNRKPDNPPQTVVVIVNEHANNEGPPAHQNKYPNQNRPQNYIPQENDLYQNGNWNNNNNQNNPPNHVNNISPQDDQSQYNTPNANNYNHNRPNYGSGNQNNFQPPNRPIYDQNNNPGFENQNNYIKPNSGGNYQQGYQNNVGQPNQPNFNHNNGYGFDNTNQDSQPNQSGFDYLNNYNGQSNPNHVNSFGQQHNQDQYNNGQANKPEHGKVVENENKKPDRDDEPLFVPLTPNEYVYGGDKILVETPKRDIENKPKPANDGEEFPIDVRFKED